MNDTLESLRKRKGLTQKALGLAIGKRAGKSIGKLYAQRKIARLEAGLANPSYEDIAALSEELGVEMEVLSMILEAHANAEHSNVHLGISDNLKLRQLLAICLFARIDEGVFQSFQEIVMSAIEKGATVMMFVPYPGNLEILQQQPNSEIAILRGYYSHIRLSIRKSLQAAKIKLGPETSQRIVAYAPRALAANCLIPPLHNIYSLTIAISEEPFRSVRKILHAWTKGRTHYAAKAVKTPDKIFGADHEEFWIPYFGDIVSNWISDGRFSEDDPCWRAES